MLSLRRCMFYVFDIFILDHACIVEDEVSNRNLLIPGIEVAVSRKSNVVSLNFA